MNTINRIALWLLDKIEAGMHEEDGSLDSTYFGPIRVTITKSDDGYFVCMDAGIVLDFTLTERMTLAEIEQKIKNWLMDLPNE